MREGLHKILSTDETIVAISTPVGRSGIGVVRVSGHEAAHIAQRFFHGNSASELEHRKAEVGTWRDEGGRPVDEVVVTIFRAPRSYTGEDVLEISAHGNPVILGRIVETVRSAGARPAAPGEFTLRAVANGKMDLIQAEAVREFIEAQTERQARAALQQMEGALSRRLRPVKEKLIDRIAHLEAGIDFAEDDVEVPDGRAIVAEIEPLIQSLEEVRGTFGYGRLLAGGLRIAILGKPNVGKSSLFNRLVAADRAIVTEVPGTTRDVVTETVSVDGIPLRFADTAGIRETTDRVEGIGMSRTFEAMSDSDFVLVVLDGSTPLDSDDRQVLSRAKAVPHLIVINKCDLLEAVGAALPDGSVAVRVSAKTGAGLDRLSDAIRGFLFERHSDVADDFILTNARQNDAIVRAIAGMRAGSCALLDHVPHEMVLLDLYGALSALGELTGEVVTEDILDRIFTTFCVGK
jgi:tRNA modification GTPase